MSRSYTQTVKYELFTLPGLPNLVQSDRGMSASYCSVEIMRVDSLHYTTGIDVSA